MPQSSSRPAARLRSTSPGRLAAACCAIAALSSPLPAHDGKRTDDIPDLTALSLEELMDLEVTTVAKHGRRLGESAAAVYVITADEIRRSGATTLTEVLRLVPGLSVARINANAWSVTSRGFGGRFANKMLVLIDGRPIYTPLFGGVYWDEVDPMLENIERIEVIRGPGATIWGANAVNGVINVIMRSAAETQGALATTTFSDGERHAGLRYGGGRPGGWRWRGYASGLDVASTRTAGGAGAGDAWDGAFGGFRLDRQSRPGARISVSGGAHSVREASRSTVPQLDPPYATTFDEEESIKGAHVLGRWERRGEADVQTSIVAFVDRTRRDDAVLGQTLTRADVEFNRRRRIGTRHELSWGGEVRLSADSLRGSPKVAFVPSSRDVWTYSGFAEDDVEFGGGRVRLTLGTKLEKTSLSNVEIQPNVRVFVPFAAGRGAVWGAVSRAVSSPSRSTSDIVTDVAVIPDPMGGPSTVVRIVGGRNLDSERLLATEAGVRWTPGKVVSFDVAAFHFRYDDLFTLEPGSPFVESVPAPSHLVAPQAIVNRLGGRSLGLEALVRWTPVDRLRIEAWYAWLDLSLTDDPAETSGVTPRNQARLRATMDLDRRLDATIALQWVDRLPTPDIPSYLRFDAQLAWRPHSDVRVELGGRNLLDARHAEYQEINGAELGRSEIERSVYARFVLGF